MIKHVVFPLHLYIRLKVLEVLINKASSVFGIPSELAERRGICIWKRHD